MEKKKYWIGEVAKQLGLSLRTIRYYEELGLLRPKGRTTGRFRLYSKGDVVRLQAIQTLKNLGYSLKDIQGITRAASSSKTGHELVKSMLADLQRQEGIAREQLKWCKETLKTIDAASAGLAKCMGCKKKPTRSHCLHCKVFPSEEEVPAMFRVAFA